MPATRKDRIRALLKGIETGDPAAVEVVHPTTYIQHNPQTHEGGEGLAALFERLSRTSPRVNVVRGFEDGDFVFAHTEHSPRMDIGHKAVAVIYQRVHRILAEGSFVLSVSEGIEGGTHSAFYDLFRLERGKLVEHWETTEAIPPRSEWKNDNGKF